MNARLVSSLLLTFITFSPTQSDAGSVNGASSLGSGTIDRPHCDKRQVTLSKCTPEVREHLRQNCYVVVHAKNAPQTSVCSWQSCAGLSLVGEKPRFKLVQTSPSNVYELDEYGIKTRVNASSLPSSWNCTATHCLPKSDAVNAKISVQKDFSSSFESATQFPRTYLTLGEAVDLRNDERQQSSAAMEDARVLLRRQEVSSVMRANPYFSCVSVPKIKFWVEKRYGTENWQATSGLDGSSDYVVDEDSWKELCRKNRKLDAMGFTYRCVTESGQILQEPSQALVWLDYFMYDKWQKTYNTYRSSNWKADCPAEIAKVKIGNNLKWRCRNEQTSETIEK